MDFKYLITNGYMCKKDEKIPELYYNMYKTTGIMPFNDDTDIKDKLLVTDGLLQGAEGVKQ